MVSSRSWSRVPVPRPAARGRGSAADGCSSAARPGAFCRRRVTGPGGRAGFPPAVSPSQPRFLSEPALHVRGRSPRRKGRCAAPRLFQSARVAPRVTGGQALEGTGARALRTPDRTLFRKTTAPCRSCPTPGPSQKGPSPAVAS